MEHKVGSTFNFLNKTLKVVECSSCYRCAFNIDDFDLCILHSSKFNLDFEDCDSSLRDDRKSVIFHIVE